jgi:hypothetical protein
MKTYLARALNTALVGASLLQVALAVPYATALKNQGGTISFILNEPADNVKLVYGTTTVDLGALPKGLFSRAIAISGDFKVVVARNAPGGWVQTSADTNVTSRYNSPRGLAVNRNPKSPYFGRAYIANSASGSLAAAPPLPARALGDGLYLLNADQSDAVGQGDGALTAGLNFSTGGASSPYRVKLGEDDLVYITDWSDAAGNLYVADPNLSAGSGQLVFPQLVPNPITGIIGKNPVSSSNNHGSIDSVVVVGSLAQGNLTVYTVDEDLQSNRDDATALMLDSVWRYDIGAGPLPYTGDPPADPFFLNVAMGPYGGQFMDLDRGPDGKFYLANRRSSGAEPGVYVIDPSGTQLWQSVQASQALGEAVDILKGTVSAAVSADGKYLATISYYDNRITVVEMTDGIPDLAKRTVVTPYGTTAAGRYIAFDAAGNLHVISSGYALYKVLAPGGSTVATTGTDGTFKVEVPPAIITVVASTDTTAEGSATPGQFTLTRSGDMTAALTVPYEVSGTAEADSDYVKLPGSVTFAPGSTTAVVTVTPKEDALSEPTETVTIAIIGGPRHSAGTPGNATVSILDNDLPTVSIATRHATAYERTVGDYLTYRMTRQGNLDVGITVNLTYGGTAAAADFTAPSTVDFLPGEIRVDFQANLIDNAQLDGDRTLIATVAAGAGYAPGAAPAATGTILDDELPSEAGKILLQDRFDADTSADWVLRTAANNNIDDYVAAFGYDLNNDAIPAAPNGSNLALKLTANKADGELSAAAVNLYPKNRTFSGSYAVRFSMYIRVNSSAGTTEHALFGVNHSGAETNWVRQTVGGVINPAAGADGLWFGIVADASTVNGLGHVAYTGTPTTAPAVLANVDPTTLSAIFKTPPWAAGDGGAGGAPAQRASDATQNWSDVEIKVEGDLVTCSVNRTELFRLLNTTPYTTGNIMIGYNDQFDSIGSDGAAYFSNLRVVQLETTPPPQPILTAIRIVGATVEIPFTSPTGNAAQFTLIGAAAVSGPYAPVAGATIEKVGDGQFLATAPAAAVPAQFLQIKR